jgi:hypothetical protein
MGAPPRALGDTRSGGGGGEREIGNHLSGQTSRGQIKPHILNPDNNFPSALKYKNLLSDTSLIYVSPFYRSSLSRDSRERKKNDSHFTDNAVK